MIALLIACSSTTSTGPGPLGAPVQWALPEGAPSAPAVTTQHEATAPICVHGELEPAEARFRWSSFVDGANSYITEVSVELTKPGENLEVVLHADPKAASSAMEQGVWKGVALVDFRCNREAWLGCQHLSEKGVDFVELHADGKLESPKSL